MKWTKKKPTKRGIYLWRSDYHAESALKLFYAEGKTEPTVRRIGFEDDE